MPRFEFVILADRAEAVGGKLYMLGGCWDRVTVPTPRHAHILSVAVSVILQPDDIGLDYDLHIAVGAQHEPPLAQMMGRISAPATDEQRVSRRLLVCLPGSPVTFPRSGEYEAVASVGRVGDNQRIEARTQFMVTVEQEEKEALPPE